MNHDTLYAVNVGPGEYPIWLRARWVEAHNIRRFHVFKTEDSGELITAHENDVRIAPERKKPK